jgi:serine protease
VNTDFKQERMAKNGFRHFCKGVLACLLTSQAFASTEIPWHLGSLGRGSSAPAAIQTAHLSPGAHPVVVAVIDSGIIQNHPSLDQQVLVGHDMLSPSRNLRGFRSSNTSPDEKGAQCENRTFTAAMRTHGTEVASVIAGNGQQGVFGVNPRALILPIRAAGACGSARDDLLDAIAWAAGMPVPGTPTNPTPAQVINLSIVGGSSFCSRKLQELIDQVTARNIFVVAAAGNNFSQPLSEPANCNGVISVGAVDANNQIANYSALDPRTTIYAPGGTLVSPGEQAQPGQQLRVATYEAGILGGERAQALDRGVGTSYAAPLVAGFISLWLSHQPHKTPADFFAELPSFTRDVVPAPNCLNCQPKSLAAHSGLLAQR